MNSKTLNILSFKLSSCCECCFLSFGWYMASEFYRPTFRNTLHKSHDIWRWNRSKFANFSPRKKGP